MISFDILRCIVEIPDIRVRLLASVRVVCFRISRVLHS